MGLNKVLFTSSGTWTAPAGVTEVLLVGCGGGGGGGAGRSGSNGPNPQNAGGGGGGGSTVSHISATVLSGSNYSVTIGEGGLGGTSIAVLGAPGNNGSPGQNTLFANLATFLGASGGQGGGQGNNGEGAGGKSSTELGANIYSPMTVIGDSTFIFNDDPAIGGTSYIDQSDPTIVFSSPGTNNTVSIGAPTSPGTGGVQGASSQNALGGGGGSGGGAGPAGNGGNGGAGGVGADPLPFDNVFNNPKTGSNAASNSGAGGGGGGAGGNGQIIEKAQAANGGNGGSGFLYIIWVDTGTGFTAGGDLSGTSSSQTVIGIQSHPVSATAPTLNQVLEWSGSAWTPTSLSSSLPPSGSASGDLSGTYPGPTVAKINATTVSTAGGTLTTGNVLRVTGTSTSDWGAVDLANASAVTGILPAGNQASQAMGGDVSGTTASATVLKIDGASVPAAGSLTTGNVLQVTGASALSYAPVNLGGGANFITGTLPAGNQASQTMAGDVTGTTAASTVAKINATTVSTAGGALTTGKVLRVTGASTSDWGAVDLANSSAVTGVLPTGNQASQSLSGDVTGTTASNTVVTLTGSGTSVSFPVGNVLTSTGTGNAGAILTTNNTPSIVLGNITAANLQTKILAGTGGYIQEVAPNIYLDTDALNFRNNSGTQYATFTASTFHLDFAAANTSSNITQLISTTGNGVDFTIAAQDGYVTHPANGGNLILKAGLQNSTGTVGAVRIGTDRNDWVSTNGQSVYAQKDGYTSTDGTTNAMVTFALPDNTVTSIYATVTARQTAGTSSPDAAEFQIKGVWRRDAAGAPVQIKAPTVVDSNPNANGTAWTAVLAISGNNVLINVTGGSGKTIHWSCSRIAYEAV